MKAPIVSTKHLIQTSVTTAGLGALGSITVVKAVAKGAIAADNEVEEGAIVKAIWIEYWVTSDDAAQGSCTLCVEKKPAANPLMTYAQSQALNDYSNKRNIFYVTQGLTPPNVQSGIPFVRQWIKIPKGKQRMALGDQMRIQISGITNGANYCGISIYKEYS